MTKRKAISKRTRFEVLKRDSFTCQYCGKMPPDVTLHLDHIKPVSKGGNNGILNLVTSCQDCNLGKSNVELSDDSAVKKQQSQLSELAEKKSQIEMMVKWRESLLDSDEILVSSVVSLIDKYLHVDDRHVSEAGVKAVRKAVKKHGYQAVIDSLEKLYISDRDFEGNWASQIKYCSKETKPTIHYIKGILRNRIGHFNEKNFYAEVGGFDLNPESYKGLVDIAKSCESMFEFYGRAREALQCQ